MRTLLAVVLVLCFAQHPAKKPDRDDAKGQNQTSNSASPVVVMNCDVGPAAPEKSDCKKAPKWYAAVQWSNWALVLIAGVTALVIYLQTIATRKAAEATRDSVEIVIKKERARVRMIVNEPALYPAANTWVRWTLENYGATHASIRVACARLILTPEREIAPDYSKCRSMFIGESVKPDTRMQTLAQIPLEPDGLTEDQLMEVKKGNLFVHFYGFVRYEDLFDRRWRRRIHLRWAMRWGGTFDSMIMQWWEPAESKEENEEAEDKEAN